MGRLQPPHRLTAITLAALVVAGCTSTPAAAPPTAAGSAAAATVGTSTPGGGGLPSARVTPGPPQSRPTITGDSAESPNPQRTTTAPTTGTSTSRSTRPVATSKRPAPPSTTRSTTRPTSGPPVATTTAARTTPASGQLPNPPRLVPQTGDFRTPETVSTRYLAVWCYMPPDKPANQNIANAAGWMTLRGWEDDKSRAIGQATWEQMRIDGIHTVCGPVTATRNTVAPNTDRRIYVQLSATRYRVQNGKVAEQDVIAIQRIVLRADDGRWLVDKQELAG